MTILGRHLNSLRLRGAIIACSAVLGLTFASTQVAKADFVGVYALSNFTLTNEDGDVLNLPTDQPLTAPSGTNGCLSADVGPFSATNNPLTLTFSCLSPTDPLNTSATSIIIVGGADQTVEPGSTILSIDAAAAGTVSFNWSYSTQDSAGYDAAGFEINGVATLLTDGTGIDNSSVFTITGSQSFTVTQGEEFGFDVTTADNFAGPGLLTISDFTAPLATADAPTPEPRMVFLILALGVTTVLVKRRATRANQSKA